MTTQRMIELLEIEHECMLRGAHDDCDRNCAACELVQDDSELHEMYTNVIAIMKKQQKIIQYKKDEMTNQEAIDMIRNDMKLHHDYLSGTYRKALNMAISALENLIPVEPVEDPNLIRGGWIGREAECCGKCGNNLRFLAKFCDKCGTPVKREDIENVDRPVHRRTNSTNSKRASGNPETK